MKFLRKHYRIILAVAISALYFLYLLFTVQSFSKAGDENIAEYLQSNNRVGYYFISPALALVLHQLVVLFPAVNIWTMFHILSRTVALGIIVYLILRRVRGFKGICLSAAFTACYVCTFKSTELNFTELTSCLALAGLVLAVSYDLFKTKAGQIFCMLSGAFFFLLAGAVRRKQMIMFIPFAVMILLFRLIRNRMAAKNQLKEQLREQHTTEDMQSPEGGQTGVISPENVKKSHMFAMAFICVLLTAAISMMADPVYGKISPAWKEYKESNARREDVYDYFDRYPSWDDDKDAYEAAGISKIWIAMVYMCYTADPNYFNSQSLENMIQFRGPSTVTAADYLHELRAYPYAFLGSALFLILLFVLYGYYRTIWPTIVNIGVFYAAGAFFILLGRYAWRVTGGVLLACLLADWLMSAEDFREKMNEKVIGRKASRAEDVPQESKQTEESVSVSQTATNSSTGNGVIPVLQNAIVSVVTALSVAMLLFTCVRGVTFMAPAAATYDANRAALQDYMNSNRDTVYFTGETFTANHNVWTPRPVDYLSNNFLYVADFNRGRYDDFATYGIGNNFDLIREMITGDKIETTFDNVWFGYLQEFYEPHLAAGIVDNFAPTGTYFIRYCSPITTATGWGSSQTPGNGPSEEGASAEESGIDNLQMYLKDAGRTDWYQDLVLEADLADKTCDAYYFNVVSAVDGATYTYPLVWKDGKLSGSMLWMNNSWTIADTKRMIIGQKGDQYEILLDVTGAPIDFR